MAIPFQRELHHLFSGLWRILSFFITVFIAAFILVGNITVLNRKAQGQAEFESVIIRRNMSRGRGLDIEKGRVNGYSKAARQRGKTPKSKDDEGINPPGNTLPVATM
jgi:hypothetical protein